MQLNVTVTWVPTRLCEQLLEELLVVYAGHSTDFCYLGLSSRVSVNEVGRDADGQFPPQLFMLKTCEFGNNETNKEEETRLMEIAS